MPLNRLPNSPGAKLARYKGVRIQLDELPEDATERVIEDLSCGPQCRAPQLDEAKTQNQAMTLLANTPPKITTPHWTALHFTSRNFTTRHYTSLHAGKRSQTEDRLEA